MVEKLLVAQLDAVFSTDPAVALWTYVKAQWGTATGYSPPAVGLIKFDTKFGSKKGFYNYFIVENMPQDIKPQTIGGARYRYNDVKRVQLLCVGNAAKNNKWLMEQHIDSIINGNPTGMQATYGIDEFNLSSFTDIVEENDTEITGLMPNKNYQVARSRALVTLNTINTQLQYDQRKTKIPYFMGIGKYSDNYVCCNNVDIRTLLFIQI